MKNLHKLFYTLMITASVVSCDVDKITSLQDTLKIIVNPDAVKNKKEISVVNANNINTVVNNISLSLSGDQASNVYTSEGKSAFVFDDGAVTIGLVQNIVPTVENPVTLSAEIKADGYLTKNINIVFDGTPVEPIVIPLIEIANLPETVKIVEEEETLTGGKTPTPITVTLESSGTEDLAVVTIPADTSFKDENGGAVTGNDFKLDITTFELGTDKTDDETGFSVENELPEVKLPNGEVLEAVSVLDINPQVGGQTVELTEDAEIEASIPDDGEFDVYLIIPGEEPEKLDATIDGAAGKSINGNKSNFHRRIRWRWRRRGFYCPVRRFVNPYCSNRSPITFTNNGAAANYVFKVLNPNGSLFRYESTTLLAGESKSFSRLTRDIRNNSTYTLKVLSTTLAGGTKEIINQPLNCSNAGGAIEVTNTDTTSQLTIPFSISCPTITVALNETLLYYKSDGNYYTYGKVINGVLTGKQPELDDNTDYTFKFNYGTTRYTPSTKGSKIKELISTYDTASICAKIEDEI